MHPDRIVIGSFDEASGDRVAALYDGFDAPVVRTSVASAEMIKLAANAFLATRISFINEIANVSEAVGANVDEVAYGMGLDRRIGTSYLKPGIGYGGSCFPKDVSFLKLLAGNSGYHFQLVSAVIEVNDLQKRRVVTKLQQQLGNLRGKKIALLGLAFKPNTDDMREAPSLVLAARLRAEGAEVRAWDPLVKGHPELDGVAVAPSLLDAVRDADAAVIVTEWAELAGARLGRGARRDADAADRRRPEPARRRSGARGRVRLRGHRPGLRESPAWKQCSSRAGRPSGSATRLQGRPKPLVAIAGRPLAAYQVSQLAGRRASNRVIVSCAAGTGGRLRGRAVRHRPGDRDRARNGAAGAWGRASPGRPGAGGDAARCTS